MCALVQFVYCQLIITRKVKMWIFCDLPKKVTESHQTSSKLKNCFIIYFIHAIFFFPPLVTYRERIFALEGVFFVMSMEQCATNLIELYMLTGLLFIFSGKVIVLLSLSCTFDVLITENKSCSTCSG